MSYDVDYDYDFKVDEYDCPFLPDGMRKDGNLYVLPNGKYLPPGCYVLEDGGCLIYEPKKLGPCADMLAQFRKQR